MPLDGKLCFFGGFLQRACDLKGQTETEHCRARVAPLGETKFMQMSLSRGSRVVHSKVFTANKLKRTVNSSGLVRSQTDALFYGQKQLACS